MSNNTEKSSKPSSADYPVDPVERTNQEARLRKAAAAGASGSKSPIPGLVLQRPGPSTTPNVPEPQTALSRSAASSEAAAEAPDSRDAGMTNDEVLAELRKISAWADHQRKVSKWSLIVLAAFVPVVLGVLLLMERNLQTKIENSTAPQQADWYDVERSVRVGDFDKAAATGEELILKTPLDPEAHERLARAYLAAGNLEKAKENFAEAFRLFPSEQNQQRLDAIEKRLQADKQ